MLCCCGRSLSGEEDRIMVGPPADLPVRPRRFDCVWQVTGTIVSVIKNTRHAGEMILRPVVSSRTTGEDG